MEGLGFVRGQPHQRGGGRRRDGVEDAEQSVRIALVVAGDQFGVVEIVAGIHEHAGFQPAAHGDLAVLVEQRDLDAVDLGGVVVDDGDRGVGRAVEVGRAPIAGERRVEHVAEPVDDDGLARARKDAAVDLGVVVGGAGDAGERARSHQHDAPADGLDGLDLFLIGADDVVERLGVVGIELVGAAARKHDAVAAARGFNAAADQFQRGWPVDAHAALGRVHGLRDAEPQAPEVLTKSNGAVPVDGAIEPRVVVRERIGDHVRGGKGDAVELARNARRKVARRRETERLERAVGARQGDGERLRRSVDAVHWTDPPAKVRTAGSGYRPSGAPASFASRAPRVAGPWRPRAECTCRARPPRYGG